MSYWVITVERETGTTTSVFVADKDTAWQLALDYEAPNLYTTVVTATNPEGGTK